MAQYVGVHYGLVESVVLFSQVHALVHQVYDESLFGIVLGILVFA